MSIAFKTYKPLVALLCTSAILFSGCVSRENTQVVEISARLILYQPLGTNGTDQFPDYVVKMCQPIQIGELAIIPSTTIMRIDVNPIAELAINTPSDWWDIIQGFYGMKNVKHKQEKLDRYFEKNTIGSQFATSDRIDPEQVLNQLNRLISGANANTRIYYCSPNALLESKAFNQRKIEMVTHIDSVLSKIVQIICSQSDLDSPPEFMVILSAHHFDTASHRDTIEPEPVMLPKPIVRMPTVDEAYAGFWLWKSELPKNDAWWENVLTRLRQLELDYTWDYRFTFERMICSIVGRDNHDEAFELLNHTAEKAINSGKQRELLDSLTFYGGIGQHGERGLWRMATNHPHDWDPVLVALRNKNLEQLPRLRHLYKYTR